MKNILILIILIHAISFKCLAQEEISPEVGKILKELHDFNDQNKLEDAFKTLDVALNKYVEKDFDRYSLLNYKFNLLSDLSRNQEAVLVAIEKANIVTSPKQALNVARSYLKINDSDHALAWIETSVSRGLQSYTVFDEAIFYPLINNQKFRSLIETVKKKNGIGLPAKPFTSTTISGEEVSLEKYIGKVIIIDFWATWCSPCVEQMPDLINLYDKFKYNGLEIIGFTCENDIRELNKFLQKWLILWPIVSGIKGDYKEMAKLYGVTNIPATFLIDKKGMLRQVNLTGNKLHTAVLELLNE